MLHRAINCNIKNIINPVIDNNPGGIGRESSDRYGDQHVTSLYENIGDTKIRVRVYFRGLRQRRRNHGVKKGNRSTLLEDTKV